MYRLADQLKYFDPVLERIPDDPNIDDNLGSNSATIKEDQPWLQELSATLQQLNVN